MVDVDRRTFAKPGVPLEGHDMSCPYRNLLARQPPGHPLVVNLPRLSARVLSWRQPPLAALVVSSDRVENRGAGVDVERVAKLVRLGRADRLDAGRHFPRVVAAETAAAHRSEQVPGSAVPEEVQPLVGHLEPHRPRLRADTAFGSLTALLPVRLEVRAGGDVPAGFQALDDLADQLVEPLGAVRAAEQPLDGLRRQQLAAQQRLENGVVQHPAGRRLDRCRRPRRRVRSRSRAACRRAWRADPRYSARPARRR